MLHVAVSQDPASVRSVDPEIGDYAIIGDCRTAALISRAGSIDWLCLPHFSGASAFAALLDQKRGGRFVVSPVGPFTAERRYLGASGVLETTFRTARGAVRLTDLMPVPDGSGAVAPMREVLRLVEGVEGVVELEVLFEPRPDYALRMPRIVRRGALGWACAWRDELLLLHTDLPLTATPDGTAIAANVRVAAGERRALSLTYAKGDEEFG